MIRTLLFKMMIVFYFLVQNTKCIHLLSLRRDK